MKIITIKNQNSSLAQFALKCNEKNYTTTSYIQPFALMFILDENLLIEKISANAEMLGKSPESFLGKSVLSLVAPESHILLKKEIDALIIGPVNERRYIRWSWNSAVLASQHFGEGFIFRSGKSLCFEALLSDAPQPVENHFVLKTNAANEIIRFDGTIEDFASLLTQHIRQLTDFDRVYCFRFDVEGNGMVIGESLNTVYPSLAMHNFPATDIPANLHEVYCRNRFRHFPNRSYEPVPLLELAGEIQPINLELSLSRQVGTSHLQYLENMGVQASLSFSIVINGKLWGLLGGHHSKTRQIPLQTLLDIQNLVELFASRLNAIIANHAKKRLNERLHHVLDLTRSFESVNCDLPSFAASNMTTLKNLMHADALIWVKENVIGGDGLSLPNLTLLTYFAQEKTRKTIIYATNSLIKENSAFALLAAQASGILALALSDNELIIWVRTEQLQQKKWGGNPHLAIQPDAKGVLGPRQSFATWVEQVRNCALPWENTDLNTAEELRLSLANVKANQVSRLQTQNSLLAEEIAERKVIEDVLRETNRQLESFAYVASHDLQEPLRMVSNYCQLLERRHSENFEGKAREYLGHILKGAKRMHQLIDSILEYSRLATRSLPYEAVDLNDICSELKNVFAEKLNSLNAKIIIENLPTVFGEKNQLYQLIQNIISNGLKFHRENQAVIIKISASQEANEFWKIAISDNGIGIPKDMQQKVFEMFQCLDPQKYEGTGIGLAVCRRVVELHGGTIWFKSSMGCGTTMFFTLPVDK